MLNSTLFVHYAGAMATLALGMCLFAASRNAYKRIIYLLGAIIQAYFVILYLNVAFHLSPINLASPFRLAIGSLFTFVAALALIDARKRG